jgi:thiol-disulfide isomerase/thioredoxin
MRALLLVMAAGLAARADDPKPKADAPAKPEITLKVGDPAPPLTVETWLQGEPVKQFEPGKVYVVEFWQTWCGPCVVAMPHLADLAEEYRPKGVTVVGFAGTLGRDKPEAVAEFVKTKGPKLGYTFAHSNDTVTTDAWMTAAGQRGIPCSFVVDQQGKIAYIGHPMTLDPILPKVVAGTFDPAQAKEVAGEFMKAQREAQQTAFAARTPSQAAEALKKLTDLAGERPELAAGLAPAKLQLLVRAERFPEAAAAAEGLLAKATKRDNGQALTELSRTLAGAKGRPELVKLAVAAADANLTVAGEKNVSALLTAHTAYAAAGDADKANGFVTTAVKLAEEAVEKAEAGKSPMAWYSQLNLAEVYKAAGDADKAKAAAQKGLDAAPKQYQAMAANMARQYGAKPKPEEGKKKDD